MVLDVVKVAVRDGFAAFRSRSFRSRNISVRSWNLAV